MEGLVQKDLTKSIAVSNCTIPLMIDMLAGCQIKPAVNQIECNPYMSQADVLRFHRKWGVTIEAYSSIGAEGSKLHEDLAMRELAEAKGCSVAQLAIAWAIKRGTVALVKTVKIERLAENIGAAQI